MPTEAFLNGKVGLCCGDSLHFLRDQPDNRYDSIVTDPPYALVSIQKRFGKEGSAPVRVGDVNASNDLKAAYARASAGFMGKNWDTGETAFAIEFWQECLRVLKPGGHVTAFGGTRTYHRLACAIEDAGFEIRDQIGWCFGSGFPKSHNAGNGWGTALKPAWEPICLARKPLIGTVAENMLQHGTGAINVDGCRIHADDAKGYEYTVARTMPGAGQNKTGDRKQQGVTFTGKTQDGRWPANIIHDGREEVLAAFPDAPGQQQDVALDAPSARTGNVYGKMNRHGEKSADQRYHDRGATNFAALPGMRRDDSGSAARFFYQAAKDDRCDLCDANIAASRLPTENIQTASSVRPDAVVSLQLESAANGHRSNDHAASAETLLQRCHPLNPSTAESNAPMQDELKIARNVSSAANLCSLCATAIAQEIVAASRSEPLGSSVSKCSIADFKKTILLRCLASYVESRENTDTILTTTNLRELFGCVFHAIAENINSARVGSEASTEPAPKRLWYSSKADASDRIGSKHPTVKPIDLMQWLVRLITPKGGLVLDPFAGTGTTAEACFREGMRCMLVERETEYQTDIRRRMALVMAGPEERIRESIKARTRDQPIDLGPLFATTG